MILVLGEETDLTTFSVIDYLIRKKSSFIKINDSDKLRDAQIEITNEKIKATLRYDFATIATEKVSAYFFRRSYIKKEINFFSKNIADLPFGEINSFLLNEEKSINKTINLILEKVSLKIGAFSKHDLEKLFQLVAAAECDLNIPSTFVCSTRQELTELVDAHKIIATKGIKTNFSTFKDAKDCGYWMYTSTIDKKNINAIAESFSPTLFQNYIEKKYELRIFYLHGKCYSMAIFSQSNEKTVIDFRRYDSGNHNRTVPYSLPYNITDKIGKLMNKLELDTGSIDMLVTNDNTFVFLEVNPDGQIGMLSYPCNYFIEREIANILSEK